MSKLLTALCIFLMIAPPSVLAAPHNNIDPVVFGADEDGDGYFSHSDSVFMFYEVFDALDVNLTQGFEFGLYFQGNPSLTVPMFDTTEPTVSTAVVDFFNGGILDLDDGLTESLFTPSTADFGLYLSTIDLLTMTVSSTVYSDPVENSGSDLFGVYELLVSDVPGAFTAMFFSEPPGGSAELLYAASFVNITPVSLPHTFILLGFSLTALGRFRRRKL